MKRREAAVSEETKLPAACSWTKDASVWRRKDETVARTIDRCSIEDERCGEHPRPWQRSARYLSVVVLLLMFAAALMFAGCGGPDLDALTEQAVGLMSSGRYDDALPIQQQIAMLDPEDDQIRLELGFNYLNHQDEPALAAVAFEEAVALQQSARNETFLAQAQLAVGDEAAAEASLRKAVEIDGRYERAYAMLAELLERQGRAAEATAILEASQIAGTERAGEQGQ